MKFLSRRKVPNIFLVRRHPVSSNHHLDLSALAQAATYGYVLWRIWRMMTFQDLLLNTTCGDQASASTFCVPELYRSLIWRLFQPTCFWGILNSSEFPCLTTTLRWVSWCCTATDGVLWPNAFCDWPKPPTLASFSRSIGHVRQTCRYCELSRRGVQTKAFFDRAPVHFQCVRVPHKGSCPRPCNVFWSRKTFCWESLGLLSKRLRGRCHTFAPSNSHPHFAW